MLVIFEGMEGCGKSSAARAVSRSLGLPVYRPFRTDPNEHWDRDSKLRETLIGMGVKVNTYIEDLYAIDLLAGIGGDVILDRSMPSGMAYGIEDNVAPVASILVAFDYWLWRLSARSDVHYIHIDVIRKVAQSRVSGREKAFGEARWEALERTLTHCYVEVATRFKATRLDGNQAPEAVLKSISEFIGQEIR